MKLTDCRHCLISEQDPRLILSTDHWLVLLNQADQTHLGRSVAISKKHIKSLGEQPNEVGREFFEVVVPRFELALNRAFGATYFNWQCLMNNSYQVDKPNPHLRWHIRPRYKVAPTFRGLSFPDPNYGEIAVSSKIPINDDGRDLIVKTLRALI